VVRRKKGKVLKRAIVIGITDWYEVSKPLLLFIILYISLDI